MEKPTTKPPTVFIYEVRLVSGRTIRVESLRAMSLAELDRIKKFHESLNPAPTAEKAGE